MLEGASETSGKVAKTYMAANSQLLIPVLMCGGTGTRLWPVSRESMPKQFVSLIGERSTFQQTLARIAEPALFARPIVITNEDFRFIVAEQLREIGVEADIVLEPTRRDSGPAVAVAAALAARRDPKAAVLVLAADHVVRKPDEFLVACRAAAAAVGEGHIVTFGIRPCTSARRRTAATAAGVRRSRGWACPTSISRRRGTARWRGGCTTWPASGRPTSTLR